MFNSLVNNYIEEVKSNTGYNLSSEKNDIIAYCGSHKGHDLVISTYSNYSSNEIEDMCIECEDCSEVIYSLTSSEIYLEDTEKKGFE